MDYIINLFNKVRGRDLESVLATFTNTITKLDELIAANIEAGRANAAKLDELIAKNRSLNNEAVRAANVRSKLVALVEE